MTNRTIIVTGVERRISARLAIALAYMNAASLPTHQPQQAPRLQLFEPYNGKAQWKQEMNRYKGKK